MCTVSEGEITEIITMKKKEITGSDVCRKCQISKAIILLRENDLYCNSCFSIYFVHKFRSTIGKSKQIKPGDKILVGLSGGLSSTALLHLISHGLTESAPKKLRFDPYVIFINESAIDSSIPLTNIICNEVLKLNLPFYFTSFEQVVKKENSDIFISTVQNEENVPGVEESESNTSSALKSELEDLLSAHLQSSTSREDFIFHLRNELICRCAKQLGFRKVFLGTNASNLSVRILSDIALGRGSQLAEHVQFKCTQFGIEVFRPMRELLEDEIEHYVKGQNITVPFYDDLENRKMNSNIVSCTQNFVHGLQKEFSSTIPTIFRTGSKLVSGNSTSLELTSTRSRASDSVSVNTLESANNSEIGEEDSEACFFCGLGKDTLHDQVSALDAIKFSKKLSASQPPDLLDKERHSINANDSDDQQKELQEGKLIYEEIRKCFCYACGNLFQELGTIDHFPARIQEKLKQRKREEEARKLLDEYLIL